MPEIGQISRAGDVGYTSTNRKVIWVACEACGIERWVFIRNGKPQSRWCFPCGRREGKKRGSQAGPRHPMWKGGRHVSKAGYVEVWVSRDDPLYCMAHKRGRVYEHRLVMARHLGRALESIEEVHHRNRDRSDNRLENLELVASKSEHVRRHQMRIAELEAEVKRLRGLLDEQAPPP